MANRYSKGADKSEVYTTWRYDGISPLYLLRNGEKVCKAYETPTRVRIRVLQGYSRNFNGIHALTELLKLLYEEESQVAASFGVIVATELGEVTATLGGEVVRYYDDQFEIHHSGSMARKQDYDRCLINLMKSRLF